MDGNPAIVINEAQLPKLVHKKALHREVVWVFIA
jgi:hypothetical protein